MLRFRNMIILEGVEGDNKVQVQRMKDAIAYLTTSYPFFGSLAVSMPFKENNSIPTMATDGQNVLYNAKFAGRLATDEIIFVIAHELMHCALQHFARQKPNHQRWNQVTDLVINRILYNGKIGRFPDQVNPLYSPHVQRESAEELYDLMEEIAPRSPSGNQGGNQSSSSSQGDSQDDSQGDSQDSDQSSSQSGRTPKTELEKDLKKIAEQASKDNTWNIGEVNPVSKEGQGQDGESKQVDRVKESELTEKWKKKIEKAYQDHQASKERDIQTGRIKSYGGTAEEGGRGFGQFDIEISELFGRKTQNWKALLRNYIVRIMSAQSFKWSSRRRPDAGFFPRLTKGKGLNDVLIGVDTSGSISPDQLSEFSSEIKSILSSYDVQKVYVLYCDAAVEGIEKFDNMRALRIKREKINPQGGGGTLFDPVFDWAADPKNQFEPILCIYMTDGFPARWPTKKPKYPVIWVISSVSGSGSMVQVPWGQRVDIQSKAK